MSSGQLSRRLVSVFSYSCRSAASSSYALTALGWLSSSVKILVAFLCLLGLIRHHIWVARNGWHFDQTPVDVCPELSRAKSTFRFLLGIQQRHCSEEVFVASWLAGGVVGHLTPDGVIVFSDSCVICFLLLGEPGGHLYWLLLPVLSQSFCRFVLVMPCYVFCCLVNPGVAFIGCYCRCDPSLYCVLVMPCFVVWCGKYPVLFYVVLHA